jgi:vacuolar-type H+-ATPase subunit E/Vma4
MAHEALIAAIRQRARQDVNAVWQQARADADRRRADGARAIEDRRARCGEMVAAATAEAARVERARAGAGARQIRAAMKAALDARLHALAVQALPQLREDGYADAFAALVRELPPVPWLRVRVNPCDQALARQHFPQAGIASDPSIAGGFVVEGDGVRVDNTFEARLEAAWPELAAPVMADTLKEASRA